jgi:hypothetical protein
MDLPGPRADDDRTEIVIDEPAQVLAEAGEIEGEIPLNGVHGKAITPPRRARS